MYIIKFLLYFSISYILLSIPIKDRPLFLHINKFTAPYTSKLFAYTADGVQKGIKSGKKFFSNSSPDLNDFIKSSKSAIKKEGQKSLELLDEKDLPLESYTAEEEELIKQLSQ